MTGIFQIMNDYIDRGITEILRIRKEVTYPYAPTFGGYRSYRQTNTPSPRTILRAAGIEPTAEGWTEFIKLWVKLEPEPREQAYKRTGRAISDGCKRRWEDRNKKTPVKFENPIDALEGEFTFSNVRQDKYGRTYYEIR